VNGLLNGFSDWPFISCNSLKCHVPIALETFRKQSDDGKISKSVSCSYWWWSGGQGTLWEWFFETLYLSGAVHKLLKAGAWETARAFFPALVYFLRKRQEINRGGKFMASFGPLKGRVMGRWDFVSSILHLYDLFSLPKIWMFCYSGVPARKIHN